MTKRQQYFKTPVIVGNEFLNLTRLKEIFRHQIL